MRHSFSVHIRVNSWDIKHEFEVMTWILYIFMPTLPRGYIYLSGKEEDAPGGM